MTTATIAAVSVADLHAGMGACNRASFDRPEAWQARACELLSEGHGPEVAAAIVARITALQALASKAAMRLPGMRLRRARHNQRKLRRNRPGR